MRGNRVLEKIRAGQVAHVVGGHSHTAQSVDFMGQFGSDGFWLEGEHGDITFDRIGDVSRACDLWNMASVMRVHTNEAGLIGRTLDCGVSGLVIPHVSTKEAAESVVRASRFAPAGMRGMYSNRRGYGTDNQTFIENVNNEILTVILIEEVKAVENLDEILSVDHIDVFFVAPGDLAQTMGYPGQMYHPEVKKLVCETLERIVASGRTAGSIVGEETFETHMEIGVKFFFTVYDHWLRAGANAYLEKAKTLENK